MCFRKDLFVEVQLQFRWLGVVRKVGCLLLVLAFAKVMTW